MFEKIFIDSVVVQAADVKRHNTTGRLGGKTARPLAGAAFQEQQQITVQHVLLRLLDSQGKRIAADCLT